MTERRPSGRRRSKDRRQQMTRALQAAIADLGQAEAAGLLWSDDVSAIVEERLGVSPSDPRLLQDPEYAGALEFASKVRQARELVEQLATQQASLGAEPA